MKILHHLLKNFQQLESVAHPEKLATPSAVSVTRWPWSIEWRQLKFLRSIDLSRLDDDLAESAALFGASFLESAILPTSLRELPVDFFWGCWRLSHVDTSRCTALAKIGGNAFHGCRSLVRFDFPRTIRQVENAFSGTAIEEVDLSETVAESAAFERMIFLKRVTLPRHCVLTHGAGLPALGHLAFGRRSEWCICAVQHVRELRSENFHTPREKAVRSEKGRVHAEVAAVFELQSAPARPP